MNLGRLYWKWSHDGSICISPNTLSFVPGLLWADINGLNIIYHLFSDGGWGRSHMLWKRHPVNHKDPYLGSIKVTKLQRVKLISLLIKTNVNDCKSFPILDMSNVSYSYEVLKLMFNPVGSHAVWWSWESLTRCFILTEEPWRRQFTVTCRETDIKFLLILFLIIPTWNICNKTAM